MRRLPPFLVCLAVLLLAPLALHPQVPATVAAKPSPPTLSQTVLPGYTEQKDNGTVTNDTIPNAELIGSATTASWLQTITGTIGTATDLDYYKLHIGSPASQITITLDGLSADYDLVLGGGSDPTQPTTTTFQSGLEGITQVGGTINSIGGTINSIGGTINSIGGTINSIGGTINSIGGTINSIGGTINSIGGTINSISAHSGTVSETIGTQLWLPGDYYVVVTTSNGEHSTTPYQLSVELTESGLVAPPPAPEVSLNLPMAQSTSITTLYIYNNTRMASVYGLPITDTNILSITNSLISLSRIQAPAEYGIGVNLGDLAPVVSGGVPIASLFSDWDANKANPLYANYIAGLIDHVIEAATTDGVSGPGTATSAATYFAGPRDTGTGAPIYSPIAFPKLRNIVLVGGDAVLPFYRIPDLTTIANEADYAAYLAALNADGIIDPNSAQGAALRYRMLLTDNPYGAGQPYRFYGYPFFLPHLAVGRIVEQPAQIARYLEYYAYPASTYPPSTLQVNVTTGLPQPSAKRAFVSGYDFLQDEASQVKAVLEQTGLISSEITHLNDDVWQRPDVEQAWFDGRLAADFPNPTTTTVSGSAQIQLSSVNAHFDHWQLLPADITGGTLTAQRLLEPTYPGVFPHLYFGDTLGYSVGCHSGYSVADEAVLANQALYQADFPQALNAHGGNWVGNTGYGYGTADGIDYSERLAVLYTEELARTVMDTTGITLSATLGDALMNAKQRYVRNAASLTAYDYKVVNIMTLYGLPFISATFTNSLPPPAEDPLRHLPGTAPLETQAPKAPNNLGRLTRTITFTIALTDSNFVDVQRTGSRILRLAPGDFQIDDEFFDQGFGTLTNPADLLRVFENDQLGAPTLPTFAYDISALSSSATTTTERLRVRDVVFVDGTYNALPGFNPQITQIVTDTTTPIIDTASEPNFAAGAGVWYPDKFFGFSSVGAGDQQFDQLTAFAAQLRADLNGTTGLLRPYTKMVLKVIYEDPMVQTASALALNADTTAPVIQSVVVRPALTSNSLAAIGGTEVVVQASDGVGASAALDVSAFYVANGNTWVAVNFTKGLTDTYTLVLPVRPINARFVVRATDNAGNSSYYTGKGHLTSQTPSLLALPLIVR